MLTENRNVPKIMNQAVVFSIPVSNFKKNPIITTSSDIRLKFNGVQ